MNVVNKIDKINVISPKSIDLPHLNYNCIESPKIQLKCNSNAKANTNFSSSCQSKKGMVPFNMVRIMPNNILKDKEDLYEQNIKLKEQIKYLSSQIVKLKTRVSIFQKQSNKLIQPNEPQLKYKHRAMNEKNKNNKSLSTVKNEMDKYYASSKTPIVYLQNQNHLKSILRQTKDMSSTLKNQNQKLKKSLKYTQTCELGIENQHLHEQCARLSKIIEINNDEKKLEIKQFEKKMEGIKFQKQKLKQINIFLSTQLRDKIVEVDSLKNQIKKLNNLQEKYEKELMQARKTLLSEKQTNQTEKSKELSREIRKKSSKKNNQQLNEIIFLHDTSFKSRSITPSIQYTNQIKVPYHSESNKKTQETEIEQILRQTITYRFKYHRYTYQNLVKDLEKANIESFNLEQMKALLTHEPFYLADEQLNTVLSFIFSKNQISLQKVKTEQFLEKIKKCIISFEPMTQQKQLSCLKRWKKILKQNQKILRIKNAQNKCVSKQIFLKMMIDTQIKEYQIQFLLSEASLTSKTINNISIQLFLNKILE